MTAFQDDKRFVYDSRLVTMPFLLLYFSFLQQLDAKIENIKAFFFFTQRLEIYEISRASQIWQTFFLHSRQSIDHFTVVGSIY